MSIAPMTAVVDAFFLCLAASMIWAPIVFLSAITISRNASSHIQSAIWPSALFIAALPALAAPVAALMGLSLRTSAPLPPMTAPYATTLDQTVVAPTLSQPAPVLELATILNAAADLYFYGFVLFAALSILRLIGFSYRVRYSYPVDDSVLCAGLADWRKSMSVRQRVRFAYSDAVSSVCVHGFFRPVVLMPPGLLERVSTSDAILMGAHELAHIKRGDTWLFAFCSLAKAFFWFNPFMRRIVAHAQLAAEQSADALVISYGISRRAYARCFVESLKVSSGMTSPQYELVPSFTPFDKRSRRERLDAILSGKETAHRMNLRTRMGLVASGAVALLLAFGQAALAVAPPPAQEALTVVPVEGRFTSGFGERVDPINKKHSNHSGVDIAAKTGTPVKAAGDGKVINATPRYNGTDAWGNVVVIDHGHGLVTRYAQLDSYIVRKGDNVEAGEVIGAVGSTGRSTGPHLHFEVLVDGVHIDPAPVVAPDAPLPVKVKRKVTLAPTAPTAASAPQVPTPAVAPKTESAPKPEPAPHFPVVIEPAPAPEAPPEPHASTIGDRLEMRLAGKLTEWNAHIDEEIFENLSEMQFRFGDVELEGFEGAMELTKKLQHNSFSFPELGNFSFQTPRFAIMLDGDELTDEEREIFERARKKAQRAAKRAQQNAQKNLERAQRDREAAQLKIERARKNRERVMREVERAERERARHFRELERDIHEHADQHEFNTELLRLREEALRDAEESLAAERAELKRLREQLESQNRNKD